VVVATRASTSQSLWARECSGSEVSYLLARPYHISLIASPVLVSSRSQVDSCRMVLITRFPLIVWVDVHGTVLMVTRRHADPLASPHTIRR
jgi:hypothetical protein